MKKILITVFAVSILLVLLAGAVFLWWQNHTTAIRYASVFINSYKFTVEIADTSEKRTLGLGGHPSLGNDEGMLFVFPDKGFHSFWMKGMNFPIDIIWIQDGIIVDVFSDAPTPQDTNDGSMPVYTPINPADMVLEINAGLAEKMGVDIGDDVLIETNR